ncbi:insulin-induced protein-domain-containing protein [Thermothelomyces heterothallicus CBS 202.75]|uniref:insulin-induced protein-domain-containing protein n=1 Tax=Thermothelomyces heterothallicus CBS 202.75 TaxID=1149848 RepID=UPI0037436951
MDGKPGEDGAGTTGPKIIRPIPRRPFNLALSSPTPPEEDDDYPSPQPHISASDLRFLAPHQQQHAATPGSASGDGSTPLSHTTSYLNLTSPTLRGIYSPSTLASFTKGEDELDQEEDEDEDENQDQDQDNYLRDSDRPNDGNALLPGLSARRSSLHPATRSSSSSAAATAVTAASSPPVRKREVALQLVLRAALLFVLGVGYGVLVTRLPQNSHHQHHHPSRRLAAAYESHCEWRYLVFWGVAGVALGSLLPWFDRFWEERAQPSSSSSSSSSSSFSRPSSMARAEHADADAPVTSKPSLTSPPQTDWALVIRGIGAFVGIVFAIRRLPWASTMQVSLTLALANPFLWYLIDRSKPGFLLSAAVGLGGAALLMGLDPQVMPAPTAAAASGGGGWAAAVRDRLRRGGDINADNATAPGGAVPDGAGWDAAAGVLLGGLASRETIETGIWMLSVLFCSCVCFGNIGRRLALSSSAAGRGRWGGVR